MKEFKQASAPNSDQEPNARQMVDQFLYNFRGQTKRQRGSNWSLAGGGSASSTFLSTIAAVSTSIVPTADNTYALGASGYKFADVFTTKINSVVPKTGVYTVYVAPSSGASPTTALTFENGILKT